MAGCGPWPGVGHRRPQVVRRLHLAGSHPPCSAGRLWTRSRPHRSARGWGDPPICPCPSLRSLRGPAASLPENLSDVHWGRSKTRCFTGSGPTGGYRASRPKEGQRMETNRGGSGRVVSQGRSGTRRDRPSGGRRPRDDGQRGRLGHGRQLLLLDTRRHHLLRGHGTAAAVAGPPLLRAHGVPIPRRAPAPRCRSWARNDRERPDQSWRDVPRRIGHRHPKKGSSCERATMSGALCRRGCATQPGG